MMRRTITFKTQTSQITVLDDAVHGVGNSLFPRSELQSDGPRVDAVELDEVRDRGRWALLCDSPGGRNVNQFAAIETNKK